MSLVTEEKCSRLRILHKAMFFREWNGNEYKSIIIQCSWIKYLVTRLFVKSNATVIVADYLRCSMTFLRRIFNFCCFWIPNIFNNYTLVFSLVNSISSNATTPLSKRPLRPLTLTLQDDPTNTFPVAKGRKKKVFNFWLTDLKFSEIKLNFRGTKRPKHNRKSLISSQKLTIDCVSILPNKIATHRVQARLSI